jgi:DNA-binding NtrC family response regulator
MKNVLLVDDEEDIRSSIQMILEYRNQYRVDAAPDGAEGLARVAERPYDVMLLDIKMPGMDGLRVLERVRDLQPDLPVVMISGHGTIETAVEATKLGAFDFLQKPLDREKLLITVRNAADRKRLLTENREIRSRVEGRDAILGSSPRIATVLQLIDRVAPTEARVLITGENGAGKELVAKAIHRLSRRAEKPLVEVNCAAIPNELIESELFGHERGSFTGATSQRIGKFELADGGTIFLDEVGDMSLTAQAKVLRALEEGRIERVGGTRQIPVDVRVVAATNKNLAEAIANGGFREDLYHRLNVIPIPVPPLRERREDIPVLVRAFTEEICRRNGVAEKSFAEGAVRKLQGMEWRGNVRELRNTVERLVIMTPGPTVEEKDVEASLGRPGAAPGPAADAEGTFQEFKDRMEAAYIRRQLELHGWNISRTAEALDIQRSHLYNKMKKYRLARGGPE